MRWEELRSPIDSDVRHGSENIVQLWPPAHEKSFPQLISHSDSKNCLRAASEVKHVLVADFHQDGVQHVIGQTVERHREVLGEVDGRLHRRRIG